MKSCLQSTFILSALFSITCHVQALTVATLPRCADNEYLTYRSGGLACSPLSGGGVSLPNSSEPSRFTAKPPLDVTNAATVEARVKVTASEGTNAPPSSIGAYLGVVVRDTNAPGLTPESGVIVDLQTNAIRLLVRNQGGDWTVCGTVDVDLSSTSKVVRLARGIDLAMVYVDGMFVLGCPVGPQGFSPASMQQRHMEFGVNGGTAAGADFVYAGLSNDGAFSPAERSFAPTPELSLRCSQMELCWPSLIGASYQVQFRSDLNGGVWVSLGGAVTGNGSTNCITDSVPAGEPQRYYRVEVNP